MASQLGCGWHHRQFHLVDQRVYLFERFFVDRKKEVLVFQLDGQQVLAIAVGAKEPLIKPSGSRVSDEMSLYASCRFRVDIRDSRPGSAAQQMGSYRRKPK